jgi:hypothetical protein
MTISTILIALVLTACHRAPESPPAGRIETVASPPAAPAAAVAAPRIPSPTSRDLSIDEAIGGHTLARHIGKSDTDLLARLRREPDISSASTYTDRETAESMVGEALTTGGRAFDAWQARDGRRPNFTLRYSAHRVIGRSVRRGRTASVPCEHALVVLRWDERRDRFYVLTSYPEDRP